MADLSPAADAIWEAFHDVAERVGVFEDYGDALAAFTRALADQVVPHEEVQLLLRGHELERLCQRRHIRAQLLAIAAELEGANPDCGEEASLHERFMEARHD